MPIESLEKAMEDFDKVINDLDEADREVYYYSLLGLSVMDIAKLMGQRFDSVKSSLASTRGSVETALSGQYGYSPEEIKKIIEYTSKLYKINVSRHLASNG